ncbi:MAG TPA: preprotein translocase subunit SecG [Candidatus Woesebacteria bacterium]|nr:preprotein translocase subunit SecG [Candidatus Woesebacteria bacterium]
MNNFLDICQLFISIILITLVLLQPGTEGGTMAFGGAGETYHTRKGVERFLHYATIFFLVLFIVNSVALLLT